MKYILSIVLFISLNSQAQDAWHTAKIKSIYPLADGKVVVIFNTDNPACTNGNTPKYFYLSVGVNGVNELGLKNMYSALLAGAASGKEVTINFDASSTGCDINRLSVSF